MRIILLNGISVNTTGSAKNTTGSGQNICVWATNFGGGSVTVQVSPDSGTTWITITYNGAPAIFTSNSVFYCERISTELLVRAVLSGASGAINVNAILVD